LHRFRLVTTAGLEPAVVVELSRLGLPSGATGRGYVYCDATAEDGVRLVLSIRSASRVILELAQGLPNEKDALVGALCDLPWEEWIPPRTPWAVRATGRSPELRHSSYAAQINKDAIRDRFRARGRECPPIDLEAPRLLVDLRIDRRAASIGLDLGGGSLHERGTGRKVEAPIREHVAAGLALLAEPRPDEPIVDPLCGSGTLIAEAAAIALGLPAGRRLERTALPRLALFRRLPLGEIARALCARAVPEHAPFLAFDHLESATRVTRMSLDRLGLSSQIRVATCALDKLETTHWGQRGLIISNPPWGLRLSAQDASRAWRGLGSLARRLPGWKLALLSGERGITRELGLKADRRYPVRVGGVDARWLLYTMRQRA